MKLSVLLISGYFTLSDKGAFQFVLFCGTSRAYKEPKFLVCIDSNTRLNAKNPLFTASKSDSPLFSYSSFLQQNSLFRYQSAESCLLLWLYYILLQLCFPSTPNTEGFFFCLTVTLPFFLSMGLILRGPECLHPHRCQREPRIRCISLSPLNVTLQQLNGCTNKVLDCSYLPGTA